MNKYKTLAYLAGIICYNSVYGATIRDNWVDITLDSANPSIAFSDVKVGTITASSKQPTGGATFQIHNQDTPPSISIDIRSGRHGSHDPVNKLQQEGFNVSHQDGNNFNFMAPFSFDVKINNIIYNCGNLALSQEDSGGFNQWSLYAKNVNPYTGKVEGIGDYINRYSGHNLTVTCLSQGGAFYQNLELHTDGDIATHHFYISTSNINGLVDNQSNISFDKINSNLKFGAVNIEGNSDIKQNFNSNEDDSDGNNFVSDVYINVKTPSNQYASNNFVQMLKSNNFNIDNFNQKAYLAFTFSFDIIVYGNQYTCKNVAEAETDGNGIGNKQWTLFAKQVDQTGKIIGSGYYTNQSNNQTISIYCSPTNKKDLKPIWVNAYPSPGGYRSFIISL